MSKFNFQARARLVAHSDAPINEQADLFQVWRPCYGMIFSYRPVSGVVGFLKPTTNQRVCSTSYRLTKFNIKTKLGAIRWFDTKLSYCFRVGGSIRVAFLLQSNLKFIAWPQSAFMAETSVSRTPIVLRLSNTYMKWDPGKSTRNGTPLCRWNCILWSS